MQTIYNGKFKVDVPNQYRTMTEDELLGKVAGAVPSYGFYYEKYDATLAFLYNENIELNSNTVVGRVKYMEEIYSKICPEYALIECSSKMVSEDRRIGIILFYSKRDEEYRYTMVASTNVDGKELLMTFDCRALESIYLTTDVKLMLERMEF